MSIGVGYALCLALFSWGAEPQVVVRTWLKGTTDQGVGTLVVQLQAPEHVTGAPPKPQVQGLQFSEPDPPLVEQVGDSVLITQTLRFRGEPGHYIIPALTVPLPKGADTDTDAPDTDTPTLTVVPSSPLYLDLAVDSVRPAQLTDIAEPPAVAPGLNPWLVAGAGLGVALAAGGVITSFVVLGRARSEPKVVLPPNVRALQAWQAAYHDPALSDLEKALAISTIFRDYTQEVLGFAATSHTSTQLLAKLEQLPHLPKGNIPRARRLLGATDLIKYAGQHATKHLFQDLDADLRGFVEATRPREFHG